MDLFFTLLPLYIVGNIHCLGMCGPLVMLLGRHPERYYYFVGRILSFSLCGMIAGFTGEIISHGLSFQNLSGYLKLLFGFSMVGASFCSLFPPLFLFSFLKRGNRLKGVQNKMGALLTESGGGAVFLVGFLTVFLPCGQTLVVFSGCALAASALEGFINGFAFACITSPSLFFAMHALRIFPNQFKGKRFLSPLALAAVGVVVLLQGIRELA